MKRRPLSRLARIRIFDAAIGICCLCDQPIRKEPWIVEHLKPLWLGGAYDEPNMSPAHQRCAIQKTAAEAIVKAKTDRQRANHLGIRRKPKSRPMLGTKASGWKHKVNGDWEPRKDGRKV